jgi:hypothetical protein
VRSSCSNACAALMGCALREVGSDGFFLTSCSFGGQMTFSHLRGTLAPRLARCRTWPPANTASAVSSKYGICLRAEPRCGAVAGGWRALLVAKNGSFRLRTLRHRPRARPPPLLHGYLKARAVARACGCSNRGPGARAASCVLFCLLQRHQ